MSCAEVVETLRGRAPRDAAELAAAEAHAASCPECRRALAALAVLASERARAVPPPSPGAARRAIERSLRAPAAPAARSRGFWAGVATGGAAAAALALAIGSWIGRDGPSPAAAAPQIALATGAVRDVNVALSANEALRGVEIHVAVTGAIGLDGYDVRELRWTTDLERGVNELSLPIVALGAGSGQLMVEVVHGERRRTFVVDVVARS